jgi:hypothetical protein
MGLDPHTPPGSRTDVKPMRDVLGRGARAAEGLEQSREGYIWRPLGRSRPYQVSLSSEMLMIKHFSP